MKGLEALDNLLNDKLVKPDKYHKTIRDIASVGQVTIIQTELMDYEETKKDLEQVMSDYQDLGNSVYKQVKALEIIKDIWGDSILTDIEKGFVLGEPYIKLPDKEKCNLLKEVLL